MDSEFLCNRDGYGIWLKCQPINKKELSDQFDKARKEFAEQTKFDLFKSLDNDVAWGKFADFAQSIVRRNKIAFIREYLDWAALSSADDNANRKAMWAYLIYLKYLANPVDSTSFIYPYDVIGSQAYILTDPDSIDVLTKLYSTFGCKEVDESMFDSSTVMALTKALSKLYQLVRITLGPTLAKYIKSEKFGSFNKASVDLLRTKSKIVI